MWILELSYTNIFISYFVNVINTVSLMVFMEEDIFSLLHNIFLEIFYEFLEVIYKSLMYFSNILTVWNA